MTRPTHDSAPGGGAGSDAPPPILTFLRSARSPGVLLVLAAVYAALGAALVILRAAPWIIALFALPTLPALFGAATGATAGLVVAPDRIAWHTGHRTGEARVGQIDHVRLDRRWDFSARATLVMNDGSRLRLPSDCLPRFAVLADALERAGVRVERHHFAVF